MTKEQVEFQDLLEIREPGIGSADKKDNLDEDEGEGDSEEKTWKKVRKIVQQFTKVNKMLINLDFTKEHPFVKSSSISAPSSCSYSLRTFIRFDNLCCIWLVNILSYRISS